MTVCAFTTDPTDAPLIRLLVEADEVTGIRESSRLMVDKITTIPRSEIPGGIARHAPSPPIGPERRNRRVADRQLRRLGDNDVVTAVDRPDDGPLVRRPGISDRV